MKKILFVFLFLISNSCFSQTNERTNSLLEYLSKILNIKLSGCSYTIYSKDSFQLDEIHYYEPKTSKKVIWNKDQIKSEFLARGTNIPSCSTIRSNVYDFDGIDSIYLNNRDVLLQRLKNR